MAGEPFPHLGLLVGGIVVEHGLDRLVWRNGPLDGVEETDEFLMAVALHAAADDGAIEDIERGEERGGAVALVVVGHGGAASGLQRQARLGTIKGLDLGFFVNRQHHRMGRRGM